MKNRKKDRGHYKPKSYRFSKENQKKFKIAKQISAASSFPGILNLWDDQKWVEMREKAEALI